MTDTNAALIADLREKAEKGLTDLADFFAATHAPADIRAWRQLLTYAPAELFASTTASAREAGRREGLEAAAKVAKVAWLRAPCGSIGDAPHDAELCEYIATAIEALGGDHD